jgi:hypothetical protein
MIVIAIPLNRNLASAEVVDLLPYLSRGHGRAAHRQTLFEDYCSTVSANSWKQLVINVNPWQPFIDLLRGPARHPQFASQTQWTIHSYLSGALGGSDKATSVLKGFDAGDVFLGMSALCDVVHAHGALLDT